MQIVVAGGHGKVAMRLHRLLAERGDRARGLIRNPDHAPDLEAAGAEPVLCDLEREDSGAIAAHLEGADAAVFAAGAGPGSGPERKQTVDLGAAAKLIDASREAGVERYVMVSAIAVERPASWSPQMRPYYEAKRAADDALRASGLAFTIVRPGRLTDDPGTGQIEIAAQLERGGEISRDDVAGTLVAVLDEPRTAGIGFDLIGGSTPIEAAVAAIVEAEAASG
jgi:uncharacterized protein YbjT (DUF2867 family)